MTTTICFSQLGSNDELVAMQKRVTIFGSALLCCQFNSDSIMVLICIVLHITWWMVHGAIWHWHYDPWLFVQCLVAYVEYKLRYSKWVCYTGYMVMRWYWTTVSSDIRMVPYWILKARLSEKSESEWDFCPSEWQNLTGVTCRSKLDPHYSPDAGTTLLSPIWYKRCNT